MLKLLLPLCSTLPLRYTETKFSLLNENNMQNQCENCRLIIIKPCMSLCTKHLRVTTVVLYTRWPLITLLIGSVLQYVSRKELMIFYQNLPHCVVPYFMTH